MKLLFCIDSDGCVFDTMSLKHKECFIPAVIKCWNLQPVARYVREISEHINLTSKYRGIHRFEGYLLMLDMLREKPQVIESGFDVPRMDGLRRWLESTDALSNDSLKREIDNNPNQDLIKALKWSEEANRQIKEMVCDVAPIAHSRQCIEKMSGLGDVAVVSSAPQATIEEEWGNAGLLKYVKFILSQECGNKSECIATVKDKYNRVIMVGDAPGDMIAAERNCVDFYAVIPNLESWSWNQFLQKELDNFVAGIYDQEQYILKFKNSLQ